MKFHYSTEGNLLKYEHIFSDGIYTFNEFGLPILKYYESNKTFIESEYFYNKNNLLVEVREYFKWVKDFLRVFNYTYDTNNKLSEQSMKFSSNNNTMYEERIVKISQGNIEWLHRDDPSSDFTHNTIELNSLQLPIKFGNDDITYSINADSSIAIKIGANECYLVRFDNRQKPLVELPQYLNLYPYSNYYDDNIIASLLRFSDRNPLKIVQYSKKNDMTIVLTELNFSYEYDSQNFPTKIYQNKNLYNYAGGSSTMKSNQVFRIQYL